MNALAWILINRRTGETRVLSRAELDQFDFGPRPADWICG